MRADRRPRPPRRILLGVTAWVVFAFLMLPLAVVFPISVSSASYLQFPPPGYSLRLMNTLLADPAWGFAFRNSLIVGTGAALLATALALGAGLWLYRGRVGGHTGVDGGWRRGLVGEEEHGEARQRQHGQQNRCDRAHSHT